MNPEDTSSFSWFDYRSRGFEQDPKRGLRIDLILASDTAMQLLQGTGIDFEARSSEKPSDHCPIWADFLLSD
jgi:exodeoxyribonuclease-3